MNESPGSALERLDRGAWGQCERCQEPIEAERLRTNPLARVCLGCLSEPEARALERDLELAASIQAALLPRRRIRYAGWEVAYRYLPLGVVSGDHCDVLVPDRTDRPLHVALGDVSGKGVAAALLMAHVQAALRMLAAMELPLAAAVAMANRLLSESTIGGSYATMVLGRLASDGGVELCNAGHCPPILVRRGATEAIAATGIPLGLLADTAFETVRIDLEPGDLLFAYSDGLSEATNRDGEQFGAERVARMLPERSAGSLDGLLDACLDAVAAFGGGTPRTDDLTLMAVRRSVGEKRT